MAEYKNSPYLPPSLLLCKALRRSLLGLQWSSSSVGKSESVFRDGEWLCVGIGNDLPQRAIVLWLRYLPMSIVSESCLGFHRRFPIHHQRVTCESHGIPAKTSLALNSIGLESISQCGEFFFAHHDLIISSSLSRPSLVVSCHVRSQGSQSTPYRSLWTFSSPQSALCCSSFELLVLGFGSFEDHRRRFPSRYLHLQ
jgi:hypothetical protein